MKLFLILFLMLPAMVSASEKCNFEAPLLGGMERFVKWMDYIKSIEVCSKEERKAYIEKYFLQIPVTELDSMYKENEYSSQKEMDSHYVWVSGKVSRIRLTFANTPVVELDVKGAFMNAAFYMNADNGDSEKQDEVLGKLRKNENVVIMCDKIVYVTNKVSGENCLVM